MVRVFFWGWCQIETTFWDFPTFIRQTPNSGHTHNTSFSRFFGKIISIAGSIFHVSWPSKTGSKHFSLLQHIFLFFLVMSVNIWWQKSYLDSDHKSFSWSSNYFFRILFDPYAIIYYHCDAKDFANLEFSIHDSCVWEIWPWVLTLIPNKLWRIWIQLLC